MKGIDSKRTRSSFLFIFSLIMLGYMLYTPLISANDKYDPLKDNNREFDVYYQVGEFEVHKLIEVEVIGVEYIGEIAFLKLYGERGGVFSKEGYAFIPLSNIQSINSYLNPVVYSHKKGDHSKRK